MRNKQAVIIAILVIMLVAICIVATPALMDVIRSIHVIPQH
jgi:hypothetical protein